jgi:hypothetical protein
MTTDPVEEGTRHVDRALAIEPGASAQTRAALMRALYEWVAVIAGGRIRPETLPPLAAMTYVLYALWAEVGTEGLEFWLAESCEVRHHDLVEAGCRRIGAPQTLDLLGAVRALFPAGALTDQEEMQLALEKLDEQNVNPVQELIRQYAGAIDTEIPERLHQYFMGHRDEAIADLSQAKRRS